MQGALIRASLNTTGTQGALIFPALNLIDFNTSGDNYKELVRSINVLKCCISFSLQSYLPKKVSRVLFTLTDSYLALAILLIIILICRRLRRSFALQHYSSSKLWIKHCVLPILKSWLRPPCLTAHCLQNCVLCDVLRRKVCLGADHRTVWRSPREDSSVSSHHFFREFQITGIFSLLKCTPTGAHAVGQEGGTCIASGKCKSVFY